LAETPLASGPSEGKGGNIPKPITAPVATSTILLVVSIIGKAEAGTAGIAEETAYY
jgi:hypothetical protein